MTSHNLAPDGLPYVEAGMIWDGVTEYHDERPPGISAHLFSSSVCTETEPDASAHSRARQPDESRIRRFAGTTGMGANRRLFLHVPHTTRSTTGMSASSTTTAQLTLDPVNQFFYTLQFREHAARFAHQLDAAMGHHTLASADERDRLAVWNTMTAMIGSAARRYAEWNEIDPEALIVGGNFDGTPRWSRDLDQYIGIDEALCGQCDIVTFARRFYLNADLTEFARLWRQGIVYRADRETTPWSPTIFDVAYGSRHARRAVLRRSSHGHLRRRRPRVVSTG